MDDRAKNAPTPRRENQRAARLAGRRAAETGQGRPPDVVCSGGFQLPKLSAFMPGLDQTARTEQPDGQ